MKALVTGATGFLGLYIVEQLKARGDHVRAFCRRSTPELEKLHVEIAFGDLQDRNAVHRACQGMDIVFHVAGVAGIWGPWKHFYKVNTEGTHHVIEGCRLHGINRLVYTSSPSVTFNGVDQCGVDESAPYPSRWLCHYPHSKALAEQAVLAANDTSLATCSLRPHLIWGPRDHHLIPRLIERARIGKLRRIGDGTNLIDMIYIENAAQAHLQAADALSVGSKVAGRAYFISQGEPVNCWQWIDALLVAHGLPRVQKSISLKAAYRIGAALEVIHTALRISAEPRMTRFLAAQLGTSHYFSIANAQRDFGYLPKISAEEGMRRLIASQSRR